MIEAKNVIKKYGQVTALDDFTVDIPKGKIGILGPNGAGKSTFVKIALGLIESTSGEITVLGENLDKNSIDYGQFLISEMNYCSLCPRFFLQIIYKILAHLYHLKVLV